MGSEHISQRLRAAIDALKTRSNLNLLIAMMFGMLGFVILGYSALFDGHAGPIDMERFLIAFAPRLSLVVLVEFLAYFFLGQYKSTLAEIRYFKNEITNVETKGIAAQIALTLKEQTILANVVSEMMRTERNFLLAAGQSTWDLERAKIDPADLPNVLSLLSQLDTLKRSGDSVKGQNGASGMRAPSMPR